MAQSTQYDQAYGAQGKPILNVQPGPVVATRDPTSTDLNYKLGREWINKSTPSLWFLGSKTTSVATWIAAGSGASGGVVTLTGDSGGAISPLAGNITVVGDSADGMSVVGTANTLTVNAAAASTTQRGTMETSTDAESVTGTSTVVAVTPASLTARLAAPSAIGGTTPAAGAFTTLSATTTITAGTDIAATAGNILINGAGKQLRVKGGAVTDFIGEATLVTGTVTIANTNIASTDKIFLQRRTVNGSTAISNLVYTISAATSFTITSVRDASPATTETNDVSIVAYHIVLQVYVIE